MTTPPPDEDPNNRIVAVTLDEGSIGRSGPDIEHERAIAIYDLIEQNLFAPEGRPTGRSRCIWPSPATGWRSTSAGRTARLWWRTCCR